MKLILLGKFKKVINVCIIESYEQALSVDIYKTVEGSQSK